MSYVSECDTFPQTRRQRRVASRLLTCYEKLNQVEFTRTAIYFLPVTTGWRNHAAAGARCLATPKNLLPSFCINQTESIKSDRWCLLCRQAALVTPFFRLVFTIFSWGIFFKNSKETLTWIQGRSDEIFGGQRSRSKANVSVAGRHSVHVNLMSLKHPRGRFFSNLPKTSTWTQDG